MTPIDNDNGQKERGPRERTPKKAHTSVIAKTKPFIKVERQDGTKVMTRGREAQTLAHLIHAGAVGDTSLGFSQAGWARRTSGYVHDLRRMGFAIETHLEPVEDGARVARYILSVDFWVVDTGGFGSVSEFQA